VSGDLILLAGLWALWCLFHSFLAAAPVTAFLRKRLGRHYAWYRLAYNLFALTTLVPILVWSPHLPYREEILVWDGPWVVVQGFMWVLAGGLFLGGARAYPLADFIGVDHLRKDRSGHEGEGEKVLVREGVLAAVRHPWYTAALLVLWGRDLNAPQLVTAAVLTLYLLIGYRLEEVKMRAEFGSRYVRYQREVSALFPVRWLRGKLSRSPQNGSRNP